MSRVKCCKRNINNMKYKHQKTGVETRHSEKESALHFSAMCFPAFFHVVGNSTRQKGREVGLRSTSLIYMPVSVDFEANFKNLMPKKHDVTNGAPHIMLCML